MPQVVTSDETFFTSRAKHQLVSGARQADEQLTWILLDVFERVLCTICDPKIILPHQNARGAARHRLAHKVFMPTM